MPTSRPAPRISLDGLGRQLFESAPDAVVVIDREGAIQLVNDHAEHLFGYSRDELLGRPVEVLVPERVNQAHPELRDSYFANPTTRPMGAGLELTARRKNGTEFPVDIALSSLQTETGILVSAAIRDITDRNKVEAKFQSLLEGAPDAIIGVDPTGTIQIVNAQAERLFGYGRSELLGSPLETLIPERVRQIHPSHRDRYFSNPTTRPMGAGLELSARRKDGTEFPVDIALSSFETEDGHLVTAAIRDITDWVRTNQEKEMLQAQLQLHQAQRMESIGQLAGGIAHDFNNLLAAMASYCQLIEDGLRALPSSEGDVEPIERLLHDIGQVQLATERAAELTRQLLIFSRREVVKPEVLSVNDTMAEMEKILRRTIGEDITLTSTLGATAPFVEVDRGQLEQIVMNLVVNARDAMPSGGRLELRTGEIVLDESRAPGLEAAAPGRYLLLSVSDTGTGMPKEVLARIFEPFYTTKEKGKGSGLGLATVYGIVGQAGGHTTVYSEPGIGTTVRVYLPASTQEPSIQGSAEARLELKARGETILLVEDEEVVREPARRLLEGAGYAVLAAEDPAHALRLAAENQRIDLLLTDVVMPGMTGKELAEKLLSTRPGLSVIFVSGYSEDVIVHQGAVDPGVVLIEKPFTKQHLLSKVREVLDMR